MAGFVLDVSACMPWCCEDEATTASEELLQRADRREALHVPSLWSWEMMNAVAVSVRRQRITAERARQFFEQLAAFDFRIAPAPVLSDFVAFSLLASRHQLTAYDASYLDLARQLAFPLSTLDDDLRKAALAEGLEIYEHRRHAEFFCDASQQRSHPQGIPECGHAAFRSGARHTASRRCLPSIPSISRPSSNL